MAELEQFALDPPVSPVRILPRHTRHQPGKDIVDRWPSGRTCVGPFPANEAAIPAQNRVWGDQAICPVFGAATGSGRRKTARSAQFMRGLGLVRRRTATSCRRTRSSTSLVEDAAHQQDQSEHLVEDQIQQPQRHGDDHAWPVGARSPLVSGMRCILEPHGLVNGAQYRVEVTPVHTGSVSAGSEGDPVETGPSPVHGHARRADRPSDGGGAARSAPGSLVVPSPSLWSGNQKL
jgi:hypothetical protein